MKKLKAEDILMYIAIITLISLIFVVQIAHHDIETKWATAEAKKAQDDVDKTKEDLENAKIGNGVKVLSSTISDSKIGDFTSVGPYAHIRNNCDLGESVRIGNFVELKNTTYGNRSKTAHLSYLGDTEVGNNTNIGCGTITVNYDGKNKYKTKIGSDAFIGCNSNLIAPLEIGDGAVAAAGTTVTENAPDDTLVIARVKQENKMGYAKKMPAGRKS